MEEQLYKDRQLVRDFSNHVKILEERIDSLESNKERVAVYGGIAAQTVEDMQDGKSFEISPDVLLPYVEKEITKCKAELAANSEKLKRIVEIIREEI